MSEPPTFRCGHAKTPDNSITNGSYKGKTKYRCAECSRNQPSKKWENDKRNSLVPLLHTILKRLDLLRYEDEYQRIHEAKWDECVSQADLKTVSRVMLMRLVVARFLKIAREQLDDAHP